MSFQIFIMGMIFGHLINSFTILVVLILVGLYENPVVYNETTVKDYFLYFISTIIQYVKKFQQQYQNVEKKVDISNT